MKVGDFDVEYVGLFTCCGDDILERAGESAKIGMRITCSTCGRTMVLSNINGSIKWRAA